MILRSQKKSRKKIHRSRYSFYKRKFRANPIFKKSSSEKRNLSKKILWYFIFFIILGGVWFFFFSQTFAITNIVIETNNVTTRQKAEKIIQDMLFKKQWNFISRANIFTFPKFKIEESLRGQFFLEELAFKRNFPHTLITIMKEKESKIELFTQSQRFLLDTEGRVIREVPQIIEVPENPILPVEKQTSHNITEENTVKITGDVAVLQETTLQKDFFKDRVLMEGENIVIYLLESSQILSGEKIFTFDDITHIIEILSVSKNITQIPCIYITLPKRDDGEIRFKTQENWEIVFDLKKDISKQLQNFELVYKEKFEDKREGLQYIDLRFDERVYYK